MMKQLLASLALLSARQGWAQQQQVGDITVENVIIKPEELYDFLTLEDSPVIRETTNHTKYYCIFRSMWDDQRHPKKYPALARWGPPSVYSHTKQFLPWLAGRQTTRGIQTYAQTAFTNVFDTEIKSAGEWVMDYQKGPGLYVDLTNKYKNLAYIPGIEVSKDYPFLSGFAPMSPSPDWFTGFYMLNVIDEYDRTFWDRIKIRTYPWDAGTDDGTTYEAVDEPSDPKKTVVRITVNNAPDKGIYVSPSGDKVLPTAEWECALVTCMRDTECNVTNWPPANGCDVLKFPDCWKMCDPATDTPCEECKPTPLDKGKVYYKSCCESGHLPINGDCVIAPSAAFSVHASMRLLAVVGAVSVGFLFNALL